MSLLTTTFKVNFKDANALLFQKRKKIPHHKGNQPGQCAGFIFKMYMHIMHTPIWVMIGCRFNWPVDMLPSVYLLQYLIVNLLMATENGKITIYIDYGIVILCKGDYHWNSPVTHTCHIYTRSKRECKWNTVVRAAQWKHLMNWRISFRVNAEIKSEIMFRMKC